MTRKHAHRPFTGWHMTAILIAFFSVVMAVNFIMARLALSTFGGTVVDNSYVASQRYNEWIARAAAQERLGWDAAIALDDRRHVRLELRKEGRVLAGVRAAATLNHPLGRTSPRALHFVAVVDGALRSVEPVPVGRWRLDLVVHQGQANARFRVDLK